MSQQQQSNGNSLMIQGRIVWTLGSSLFEGKKKTDDQGRPVLDESGQQATEYGFGLAVAKIDPRTGQTSPEYAKIWEALHREAYTLYPNGQLPPDFAMKYKDGDGIDHNGKPFSQREGYKGHLVLGCTTQIAIKYFVWEAGNNKLVNAGIKCGDYVNVQLNIKAHPAKGRGKAGLYLNPSAVQLIQSGQEIINAPSGDQVFGMNAPVYNGEVVAPQAPTFPTVNSPGMQPPQAPQQPAYPQQPAAQGQWPAQPQAPQYPQGNYPAAPAPAQPPAQPHYDVLPPNMQPGTQQQPQYPQQPAYPQYPPQGQGQAPQMPAMPGMPR